MAVVPLVALAACSSVPNAATHNGAVPTAAQIGASVHNRACRMFRSALHSSPTSQANTYLEISFKAGASGSLADPSFVYKDTQTVTLYQAGTLVWGTEPKA